MNAMLTRRGAMLATALVLVALPGCSSWSQVRARRDVTASADAPAGAEVRIKSRNGSIEVTLDDTVSTITVDATLSCSGSTQAEADARVAEAALEIEQDASRVVRITPVFPQVTRSGDGASLSVRMPAGRALSIDTGNGRITVMGGSGTLNAHTSNGRIQITDFDGSIDAHTSNGAIIATGIGGGATMRTSNGRITLQLADGAPGPVDARTSNGRVHLTVGSAFVGTISMGTSNGSVTLDDQSGRAVGSTLSRRSGEVVFTTDGPASRIHTSNGGITVTAQ